MIKAMFTEKEIDLACEAITGKKKPTPALALILDSDLGGVIKQLKNADTIKYADIPHWPQSTVEGHSGNLIFGNFQGRDVLIMQGRIHSYEGYPIQWIGFPIRVMQRLGKDYTQVSVIFNN